jgi:hypothetical protein
MLSCLYVLERYCPAHQQFRTRSSIIAAHRNGQIDVSKMEALLGALLAKQLAGFYQAVGGKLPE